MGNILFWFIFTMILIAGVVYLHRVGRKPKPEEQAEPHET